MENKYDILQIVYQWIAHKHKHNSCRLGQDAVHRIKNAPDFFKALFVRDREAELTIHQPHFLRARVSLEGLEKLVSRGGKVLHHHEPLNTSRLFPFRRLRHITTPLL